MAEKLKVPFGINGEGLAVPVAKAKKGEIYTCPSCSEKLVFRAGKINAHHFSHPANTECDQETVLHKTAKRLIRQVIEGNADGKNSITLDNSCPRCGEERPVTLPPTTFSGAKEEVGVSGYVCDVVGYRGSDIALGIEILVTHEVGEAKAEDLSIYWIELTAQKVLSDPRHWCPTQSKLKQTLCQECRSHINFSLRVANVWGIPKNLYTLAPGAGTAPYVLEHVTCYRCRKVIPVFWWRGVPYCEASPPVPKPETIKWVYSETVNGFYWANICINCGIFQGDYFLWDSRILPAWLRCHTPQSNRNRRKRRKAKLCDIVPVVSGLDTKEEALFYQATRPDLRRAFAASGLNSVAISVFFFTFYESGKGTAIQNLFKTNTMILKKIAADLMERNRATTKERQRIRTAKLFGKR